MSELTRRARAALAAIMSDEVGEMRERRLAVTSELGDLERTIVSRTTWRCRAAGNAINATDAD